MENSIKQLKLLQEDQEKTKLRMQQIEQQIKE